MPICSACGVDVRNTTKFCPACGNAVQAAAIAEGGPAMPGTSLHIDSDTVNAILKAFADQPGGPTFTFQDGRIVVRAATGTSVSFVVDRISVGAQGVDVNVSVAIAR